MSAICRSALFPIRTRTFDLSLYLVANRPSFQDEGLFVAKIMEAVKGGVSCVQFRDHSNNFATTLKTARVLKKMLQDLGVPFIVNTLESIELALAIQADGVYLEETFPYPKARILLGNKAIIGMPVKTKEEVMAAIQISEIDYLSVKIFPSKRTCPKNDALWGMDGLQDILKISPHPIVAIGGINLESAESVYKQLRINDGIAMAGGIMGEEDPCATAQKIQAMRQKIREAL